MPAQHTLLHHTSPSSLKTLTEVFAQRSAFASTSVSTILPWPFSAAKCSGVYWSWFIYKYIYTYNTYNMIYIIHKMWYILYTSACLGGMGVSTGGKTVVNILWKSCGIFEYHGIGVKCRSTVLPAANYTMYVGLLGCLSTKTVGVTNNGTDTSIINVH
jgi:hypothetical protein